MQQLPPSQAGFSLLTFMVRLIVAVATLAVMVVLVTFGIAVVLALLAVFLIGGFWVRWKASREGMEWKEWVQGRMRRGARAGAQASWREAMRSEDEVRARNAAAEDGQDFYTTITTIEGEYAVVEEQKAASRQPE
jgi:hypothetical protein